MVPKISSQVCQIDCTFKFLQKKMKNSEILKPYVSGKVGVIASFVSNE